MPDTFNERRDKMNISTDQMTPQLLGEIAAAFKLVRSYGSIEIYIQNSIITQISVRTIKKTSVGLSRG